MQLSQATNYEAAILTRVIQPGNDDFPPAAAKAILRFTFPKADRDRMHQLAAVNSRRFSTRAATSGRGISVGMARSWSAARRSAA